ncbi:MAG: 5-carboxymethyl-2-hydroxymuconate Delta-isomerase [Paracoccaceae bacterium]
MPHVSIEFSKGLERDNDIQSVCEELHTALAATDVFDPPTIKVRAKPVEFSCVGGEAQTFVHATLLLMAGRDEPTRKSLNKTILDVLGKALPGVESITVQDVEMTRATYAGLRLKSALA